MKNSYYRQGGMSKARIEQKLGSIFDSFLSSLGENQELKAALSKGAIITGGSIASLLLGEKVNDYDIYLESKELAKAVRKHYFKTVPEEDLPQSWSPEGLDDYIDETLTDNIHIEPEWEPSEEEQPHRLVCITQNAISLSGGIQIITRFTGSVTEIHQCYDFIHCTNYWLAHTGKLHLRKEAMESLLCKQLRYQGSRFPVCSILRIRKFLNRGWTINAGQVLKILLQISALDLTKVDVLKEQLIGVDSLYFSDLLKVLEKETSDIVEFNSLVRVIDKIFN